MMTPTSVLSGSIARQKYDDRHVPAQPTMA
jgi:hypothetical protein